MDSRTAEKYGGSAFFMARYGKELMLCMKKIEMNAGAHCGNYAVVKFNNVRKMLPL